MLYVTSPVPGCSTAEMFYGNQYEFTSLVRELDAPGELGQAKPPGLYRYFSVVYRYAVYSLPLFFTFVPMLLNRVPSS